MMRRRMKQAVEIFGIKIFLRRDITSKLRTEMVPQRKFNSRMMMHMNLNLMTVRMMMEMFNKSKVSQLTKRSV